MSKKGSGRIGSGSIKKNSLPNPIIYYSVLGFVCLFMLIAPFSKGLFNGYHFTFEGSIYAAAVWTFLALFFVAIYLFRNASLTSHRDIVSVLIWLIPLTTLISYFSAASAHFALNEVYIRFMWVVFFLIGAYFASHQLGNKIIQFALIGTGYILVIYGLMNWFGNASYQDALIQGNRLSNVFQYPNAYAAYLIPILLGSLTVISTAKSWQWRIAPAFMLLPIALSFLLTLSRGALLVLIFIVLLYLVFIPLYKQLFTLLYLGLAGGTSLLLFSTMTSIRTQLDQGFSSAVSAKGWAILVVASLIICAIVECVERYVVSRMKARWELKAGFRGTNLIIPVAFLVAAIIAYMVVLSSPTIVDQLPERIKTRIEGLTAGNSSVSSRNTFYQDSIEVFKDYPIFGVGGGAWSVLYKSYQNYPYISTQAHNFIMQYLIETGVVGLFVLLGVVIYSFYIFIRNTIMSIQNSSWELSRLIFPLFSLSILLHSMLDFDMSYVYLSCIVFLTLGASISDDRKEAVVLGRLQGNRFARVFTRSYSAAICLIALVVLISGIRLTNADAAYKKALDTARSTGDYSKIKVHLDKAINNAPSHPEYGQFKVEIMINLYSQTKDQSYLDEAWETIESIENKEKYNYQIMSQKHQLYLLEDKFEKAVSLAEEGLLKNPWNINAYEKAINNYFQLGIKYRQSDLDLSESYWDKAIDLYNKVNSKLQYIASLEYTKRYESRNFKVTPEMALPIGQIHFMREEYTNSSDVLGRVVSENMEVEINRVVMRWFLAALKEQGKWHEGFYNNLITADPNEVYEIQNLSILNK